MNIRNKILFLLVFLSLTVQASELPQLKLVIIGDSLTEGYGVDSDKAYPKILEGLLKTKFPKKQVQVINGGVSGSTTASAIDRYRWYLKTKPTHIIIALGANDGLRGHTTESSYENLAKVFEVAKDRTEKIYLAQMMMPNNYGKEYQEEFAQTFQKLAKKYQIPLIPFLLQKVALDPKLNLKDGIHPNEQGHEVVAKTLLEAIGDKL